MVGGRRRWHWWAAGLLLPAVAQAQEAAPAASHADPVTAVLATVVVMLVAAKLGGAVFLRLRQPAVLGELVAGVVLGNLTLLTGTGGAYGRMVESTLQAGSPVDILARLGVVLLLFAVGLETNLADLVRVGWSSFLVATIGVITPFVLGYFASVHCLPGHHPALVHVFIGSVLCATSVGITARVFQELRCLDRDEARIVLGAAVIDDVLGLVILAVVTGVVTAQNVGGSLAATDVVRILLLAVAFLFGSVAGGRWVAPRLFRLASRLAGDGLVLVASLGVCFVLAAVANLIGLAPIVGAFAAGLLLDDVHYQDFRDQGQEHRIEERLEPLTQLLVPLFFVQMGLSIKLQTFAQPGVLGFAAVLTVAAVLGKQACGLGVLGRGLDRVSVGVAMIPRGEVGLIVAAIGRQLLVQGDRLISDVANSAVIVMIIITTMVTPPLLQVTLRRGDARRGDARRSAP